MLRDDVTYAGFWFRVWAAVIDLFLIVIITYPTLLAIYGFAYFDTRREAFIAGPADFFITWIFPAIATILFWIKKQATPGKMAISARIVDVETMGKPSVGKFIGRYFALFLSSLPLGLGIFWIAFDKRKQGWHDKLAGTVVIRLKTRDMQNGDLQRKVEMPICGINYDQERKGVQEIKKTGKIPNDIPSENATYACSSPLPSKSMSQRQDIVSENNIPLKIRLTPPKADLGEEDFYAQAFEELESDQKKVGLWAKVFAEAQGNESLAKANYLKIRSGQLANEYRQALLEKERQRQESKKIAEMERQRQEREKIPEEQLRSLAKLIQSQPYVSTAKDIVKKLGGTLKDSRFTWFLGGKMIVNLYGETNEFSSEYDFAQWVKNDIAPRVLGSDYCNTGAMEESDGE